MIGGRGTGIPTERLAPWLEQHVPGFRGPATACVVNGGNSNPVVRVDSADGRVLALRSRAAGVDPRAHPIDREYRVLRALAGSPVPVPAAYAYCDDPTVIGQAFYVMDFVAGRIIDDARLPGIPREQRPVIYEDYVRTFARLHSLDWRARGLAEYGKGAGYVRRQLRVLTQGYRAWNEPPLPELEWLIDWLERHVDRHVVDDHPVALVHGDVRIGNCVIDPASPRIAAVLDWEVSTLGDPIADAALLVLPWYLPPTPCGDFMTTPPGAFGIPPARQLIDWYCDERGLDALPALDFMIVFQLFRYSAANYGIGARARRGQHVSDLAEIWGALAGPNAARARTLIESGELCGGVS
jgi:aminoglycoside phosphotransferase (APT) family kinase protein